MSSRNWLPLLVATLRKGDNSCAVVLHDMRSSIQLSWTSTQPNCYKFICRKRAAEIRSICIHSCMLRIPSPSHGINILKRTVGAISNLRTSPMLRPFRDTPITHPKIHHQSHPVPETMAAAWPIWAAVNLVDPKSNEPILGPDKPKSLAKHDVNVLLRSIGSKMLIQDPFNWNSSKIVY